MKVLVPLDQSDLSLSIIPAVRRLLEPCLQADARLAGLLATLPGAVVPPQPAPSAEIHFLTVLHPRRAAHDTSEAARSESMEREGPAPEAIPGAEPVHLSAEARQRSERAAATRLGAIARERFPDAICACHVLWSEAPADRIVAFAEELGVDAIVMATHGRTAVARLLAGSVAAGVIRKSRRPVVVQRPPMEPGHIVSAAASAVHVFAI